MSNADPLKQQLIWLSKTSGEDVQNWGRVSHGDIVCFILFRMNPETVDMHKITDGIDRFARVSNWRIANQAMRKLGIGWSYDEVKLVMEDVNELSNVIRAIKRWETRNLDEPLEPITPDEWDDDDLPPWFQQQAAKKLEEKMLAAGESSFKKTKKVQQCLNFADEYRKRRVDMYVQMGRKTSLARSRPRPLKRRLTSREKARSQLIENARRIFREKRVPMSVQMGRKKIQQKL
jgi:hypothetical protein